jgi:hypothetical protein
MPFLREKAIVTTAYALPKYTASDCLSRRFSLRNTPAAGAKT